MSKKKRLIKKRKILLSTLVPIGCVGATLAVVLPLVVKCNGDKVTLNSKEDAQKYLENHKKVHNDKKDLNGEELNWSSLNDQHMCIWFGDTDNFGSQNMVNYYVKYYGNILPLGPYIKKTILNVQENKFSIDFEYKLKLDIESEILKKVSMEGEGKGSQKIIEYQYTHSLIEYKYTLSSLYGYLDDSGNLIEFSFNAIGSDERIEIGGCLMSEYPNVTGWEK